MTRRKRLLPVSVGERWEGQVGVADVAGGFVIYKLFCLCSSSAASSKTALTVRLLKIQEIPLFLFMTNLILIIHITNVWDGSRSSIVCWKLLLDRSRRKQFHLFYLNDYKARM